jgi:hypothetical protein
MKTKTHFAFRVDLERRWREHVDHLAGVDDFEVAKATYRAAVGRWRAARITLRQGVAGCARRRLTRMKSPTVFAVSSRIIEKI